MTQFNNFYKPRTKSLNNPRDKSIAEAMDRKERGIKKFQDDKAVGIAISSAFNGATSILCALVQTGEEKFSWERHHEIYLEYLERFANAQVDGVVFYNEIRNIKINDQIENNQPDGEQIVELDL